MPVYFTSDLHFNHENIIKFCGRPFGSIWEMNETLIHRFNEAVGPEDTVYILGDLIMGPNVNCARRLNGRKFLLMGNHDTLPPDAYEEIGIEVICENGSREPAQELLYEGYRLVHSPLPVMREVIPNLGDRNNAKTYRDAGKNGKLNHLDPPCICGHVHRYFRKLGRFVNVSVEMWDYRPILWEDVLEAFHEPDSRIEVPGL